MIDELFTDDIINSITDGINNYIDIYKATLPKLIKFKRRYKFKKGKFREQYVVKKNLLNDLMISPNILLRPILRNLK